MTGRFINADDISYLGANGDLAGYNLFAYCSNNPVDEKYFLSVDKAVEGHVITKTHARILTVSSMDIDNHVDAASSKSRLEIYFLEAQSMSFLNITKEGIELINYDASVFKAVYYLDDAHEQSVYIAVGNVSAYAGINYKEGIGVDISASAVSIGYDGGVFGFEVSAATVGSTFMYKDNKLNIGSKHGACGFEFFIDFSEIWNSVFGGN